MSSSIFPHAREAVRVKVKKCEPNLPPEWRKFSVDPQITSLEVLYSLLAKAFDIKSDFSIKYKAYDPAGNEIYLAVLSDWDLDAAFHRIHSLSIQTSTEPCLMLQIDIKPFTDVKEWDPDTTSTSSAVVGSSAGSSAGATPTGQSTRELMSPLQQSIGVSQKYVQQMQTKLPGLIMNQMEKTFSMVQKAFNLTEETMAALPPRPPLADNEFRIFLDALGQIQRSDELRKVIFLGGIDPSLRRVVWKHILNVYPCGMNGHQRMDYMRTKSEHYYKLRDIWKSAVKQGFVVGELAYVTSMVKKDVLRTDRLHPFYAGSDDNQNIASLFNILTTYALNHPSVSYCQGMSDIASPLLVTMNDEAQAYICFCAIMNRVRGNFMLDGIAMTQKFAHLTEALSYYDSEFWEYLKAQQADDLLFCYRWLLLELKREFPFEDALRMLEVQWSSLKYEKVVEKELQLFEKEFVPTMETTGIPASGKMVGDGPVVSPSYLLTKPRENAYTKVCALRRQSSSASLSSLSTSLSSSFNCGSILSNLKLNETKHLNQSLDDNIVRHGTRRQRRATSKAHQSMDETKMLQLLEGRAKNTEALGYSKLQQTENNHTDDDDVFSELSHPLTFHDTNPFKDDTPLNGTLTSTVAAPNQSIHKAFLSSSSSSIIADESSGGTGDTISSGGNSPPAFICHEQLSDKKPLQVPKSVAKLQNKNILSNYNTVSNIIAKQLANASTVSESVKRVSSTGGGHFKDLKEKIAATSRKAGLSLEENNEKSQQQRLVKNFNEFLNFATLNKGRVGADDKGTDTNLILINTKTPSPQKAALSPTPHPLVQLTKGGFASSLEESDSSSLPDTTNTTWSCSTAATAIQQANNLSSNSLHLDLNSLSSLTHTPERTPIIEPVSAEEQNNVTPTSIPDYKQSMRQDDSSPTPDDSQETDFCPMTTAITRELRIDADNLDRQVYGDLSKNDDSSSTEIEYQKLGKDSLDMIEDLRENDIDHTVRADRVKIVKSDSKPILNGRVDSNLNISGPSVKDVSTLNPFLDETIIDVTSNNASFNISLGSTSMPEVIIPISTAVPDATAVDEMATTAAEEDVTFARLPHGRGDTNSISVPQLPPPSEFGGGNPFLMFLCLTLLLQHRNVIIKSHMDYNEIAMHFDKMVRKHDVTRVLNQARRMYIDYLKTQAAYSQERKQVHESPQSAVAVAPQNNDFNKNATNNQRHQPHSSNNHTNHVSSTSAASLFYTKS